MKKFFVSLVICLMMLPAAFADIGPVAPAPEDVTVGACDPLLGNWATDQVVWTQMANATATFRRAASGAIGDYWYCFGDQYTPTAHAFNLVTEQWEPSTSPPVGTCNWPGVATDSHLYLICAYNPGYNDNVQRFTPTAGGPTGVWDQMAAYPMALCGVAAAWDGGDHIYAAGGGGSAGAVANAYVYSISGDMWMPIASLPEAMKYCGGAFCGGEFHVIGGYNWSTTHYAYDPVTDTWSAKAAIPNPVYFATFSVSNDPAMTYMYSIGGGGGYGSWPATDAVQIYDPVTDTWTQETVLPVAYGTNAAGYIDNGIAMSAGGYDGVTNHAETYQGTGFPYGSAGPFNMNVELTYVSGSPVPATGGDLVFDVFVENLETFPVNFDGWLDVEYAGGAPTTMVLRSFTNFLPTWTINRPGMFFPVPDTWSAGNYMFWGRVGNHPGDVWDESGFPFEKLGAADAAFVPWVPEGVPNPFDEVIKNDGVIAEEFALIGNYPNPFNPTTTISYSLENAGNVTLAVFDVTGREVAKLVDGYRNAGVHEVTFDASGLASGVYIYRLTADGNTSIAKMVLMK
jgi:hypothetical protein